jgi:nucleoid DNA-binding protein
MAAKKSKKKSAAASATSFSFPKVTRPRTKGELIRGIADATAVPRKQVANVFEALAAVIGQDVAKLGTFTLPGLAKIVVVKKPATKARKGINPFTKEPMVFKAKPARKVVRVRPLRALKAFVQ